MTILALSFTRVALGVLYTSITIIILYFLYRRLLAYLNRDTLVKAHYCELESLESNPTGGEIEFCFTSEDTRKVTFEILDAAYQPLETVVEKEFGPGQHIVRYDSRKLDNGTYFYQLTTENQQVMKKMNIFN